MSNAACMSDAYKPMSDTVYYMSDVIYDIGLCQMSCRPMSYAAYMSDAV